MIKILSCKWPNYPAKREIIAGPVTITTHFPGCRSFSVELYTRDGIIGPGYVYGADLRAIPFRRALLSPWSSLVIRFGRPIITIYFSRASYRRCLAALESARVR